VVLSSPRAEYFPAPFLPLTHRPLHPLPTIPFLSSSVQFQAQRTGVGVVRCGPRAARPRALARRGPGERAGGAGELARPRRRAAQARFWWGARQREPAAGVARRSERAGGRRQASGPRRRGSRREQAAGARWLAGAGAARGSGAARPRAGDGRRPRGWRAAHAQEAQASRRGS
jgi:hypothetical protein